MHQINDITFKTEVLESKSPVLVMFYADWCSKCAMMKPVVESLGNKYCNEYKFCKVNIEECPNLAAEYETDIVPAFAFFTNGELLAIFSGMVDEDTFESRLHKIFIKS